MKSNTEPRRFKLTRELKLALTGVALVGAVGVWYTLTASRSTVPDQTGATVAPPSTTPDQGTTNPGATGTAGTPADPTTGVTVTRPTNPATVEQIPFLTTEVPQDDEPVTTDDTSEQTSASADDSLPNPFRPFEVAAQASVAAPSVPSSPPRPVPPPS